MTRKRAIILIILLIALVLIACAVIFSLMHSRENFIGTSTKTRDSYALDIQHMSGDDRHTLELRAGDVLRIEFETQKGSLHMEIIAPDGTSIYDGNGSAATDFELNIPQDGVYTVVVSAHKAAGKIHIQQKKSE